MAFQGWNRGRGVRPIPQRKPPPLNYQHLQPPRPDKTPISNIRLSKPTGDTILPPPEGLPADFYGLDDASLYRKKASIEPRQYFGGGKQEDITSTTVYGWGSSTWNQYNHSKMVKWLEAHIPIPGWGSIMPHIYIPLIAHQFFRSWLIVIIMVAVWAFFETTYLIVLKWSKLHPILVGDNTNRIIRDASGKETYAPSPNRNTSTSWTDFETRITTTTLFNPIAGIAGIFISWYLIRAVNLPPFDTHLSSAPSLDPLLISEFAIFFLITAKLGQNTAWLWTAIGVPIYILALMAPVNRGYTHGFSTFSPYLTFLLLNIYVTLWFLRDPFGIGRLISKHQSIYWTQQQQYYYALQQQLHAGNKNGRVPLETPGGGMVFPEDPRKNSYYWWSIDGTYGWNCFFSMTLLVVGLSLYKVIAIAS